MKSLLFLISMLFGANSTLIAQTTVYHYISEPYVAFDALSPDSDVVLGPFSPSMRLQGSITVEQPFASHLRAEPIGPGTAYPIAWSFDNGLLVLSEAEQYLAGALVSTNANGDITSIGLNGLSSTPPFTNGQQLSGFFLLFSNNGIEGSSEGFVFNDLLCSTDNDEQCHELDISSHSSAAVLPVGGSWSRATEPNTQVPGLGGFALGLGALMLGMVVRRSPPGQKTAAVH